MALDPVPWLIDGGAVHSAAVVRTVPYLLTGGNSGVAAGGDLAVKALAVPGGFVRVLPGVAAIKNSYASQVGQSYVARAISETNVAVAPTSGSIRSDMVVLRIDDPQYGGSAPVSIPDGPYVSLQVLSDVGAGATEIPGYVTYPAIPLARIDIPASTSVITGAMVKDIRKLTNARSQRSLQIYQPTSDQLLSSVSPTFANWPQTSGWDMAIPSWASQAVIIAQMAGIKFAAPAGKGSTKIKLGTDGSAVETQATSYDNSATGTDTTRQFLLAAGPLDIPSSYRGTTQTIAVRGTIISGSGTTRPVADTGSSIVLDVEFIEKLYIP